MKILNLHYFQNECEMEATEYIAGYIKRKIERKFPAQSVYKMTCFVLIRVADPVGSGDFAWIRIRIRILNFSGSGSESGSGFNTRIPDPDPDPRHLVEFLKA